MKLAGQQSDDIAAHLDRDGIRVVRGHGRLDGPDRVAVTTQDGEEALDADAILLATGASPRTLPTAQPDGERILTWEQVYDITELPERLVVVGSGVTGAEFASAYLSLGQRRHPRLVARPGAARRGRRRRGRARGRAHQAWHEGALHVADAVGRAHRRLRAGDADRRPHGRGLALHPGPRLGAQHRGPRSRRGRRGRRRRWFRHRRPRLAHLGARCVRRRRLHRRAHARVGRGHAGPHRDVARARRRRRGRWT